jgi:hypothetical protein
VQEGIADVVVMDQLDTSGGPTMHTLHHISNALVLSSSTTHDFLAQRAENPMYTVIVSGGGPAQQLVHPVCDPVHVRQGHGEMTAVPTLQSSNRWRVHHTGCRWVCCYEGADY